MKTENALRISFLIALISTLGSLYFSEVMGFLPCVLCWYQRICMYPLVVVFAVALWSGDHRYYKYSLPLILVGLFFAGYHNLLNWGVIPQEITPCRQGVSCTTRYIQWFGFVTIPLLSLVSFATLFLVEMAARIKQEK